MYETWYEGYMQLIRRWLVNPIEFFPQFPSLSIPPQTMGNPIH